MENFLAHWGYLAVFVLSFISSMGLPVGAEVALIYGGVLASGQIEGLQHPLSLPVVIVVAVVAELAGSQAWFAKRGEPFVLFGRFIPLLRSFVSFAAGLGEMAIVKFVVFTVIGCAIWCTALVSLRYSLGSSYNHVLKGFSDAGYVLAALAVVGVVVLFVHRLRVVREEGH
jgi:membrane protein DedA with SNARE-associated domain